jgi:hypothetical protein
LEIIPILKTPSIPLVRGRENYEAQMIFMILLLEK